MAHSIGRFSQGCDGLNQEEPQSKSESVTAPRTHPPEAFLPSAAVCQQNAKSNTNQEPTRPESSSSQFRQRHSKLEFNASCANANTVT